MSLEVRSSALKDRRHRFVSLFLLLIKGSFQFEHRISFMPYKKDRGALSSER